MGKTNATQTYTFLADGLTAREQPDFLGLRYEEID